ncbi:MAG: hypothetical protein MR265_01140 [Erysipelotrichaceae bacterium]|nr:hypothetical protein [Erysipelotrichaceae bacterium]
MALKINKEKFCSIIFVMCALMIIFAPYQSDSTLSLTSSLLSNIFKVLLYTFTGLNIILIIFPILKYKKTILRKDLFQTIPMIIFVIISSFHTYDGSISFSGFLFSILWIIFALAPDNIKKRTFIYFKNAFIIICIAGIICYLSYDLNLFLPYKVVNYYNNNATVENYIDYKFIFLYRASSSISLVRLCGICNEPGYFGTICALILCASSLNLKKKSNIIILIAGFLTFSLAFIITLVIYLLLKYLKDVRTVILTVLLTCFYLFLLPNIYTGNPTIDRFIQRMTITDEGLAGDNRTTDELEYVFDDVVKNKPLFGYGEGYLKTQNLKGGVSSYKTYIIQYGFVGCILLWGSLLLAALYKNKNYLSIIYIIAFFVNIYQRPNIMTLQYQILLFGGLAFINAKLRVKENANNTVEIL